MAEEMTKETMRSQAPNSFSVKWPAHCPAKERGDQTQDYRHDPGSAWTENQDT